MKTVKAQLPADRVEAFEKGAAAFAKKIVANFKDYEFVSLSIHSGIGSFINCLNSTLART